MTQSCVTQVLQNKKVHNGLARLKCRHSRQNFQEGEVRVVASINYFGPEVTSFNSSVGGLKPLTQQEVLYVVCSLYHSELNLNTINTFFVNGSLNFDTQQSAT